MGPGVKPTLEHIGGESMVIPSGRFQDRQAMLIVGCDCVVIEGEIVFCVKDGKIVFPLGCDERDLRHVYDLLLKAK
jgi:hypothetical protein